MNEAQYLNLMHRLGSIKTLLETIAGFLQVEQSEHVGGTAPAPPPREEESSK